MQDYKDTYLENQVRQLARLQAEGKFIAADEYLTERLPLPRVDELPGIEYDTQRYGYVAPWGRFVRGPVSGSWLLSEGNLPEKQNPIRSVTAQVKNNRVFILLDEQTIPTPERRLAGENAYNLLARVNAGLVKDQALGAVVCRLEWDEAELDKRLHDLRLANDHVSVVCSSAVWDPDRHALVAVTLVSPEQQSLRAITATLCTNSKKSLTLSVDNKTQALENTRRKYIAVSGNLAAVGAEGHLVSLLHPLSGNPQDEASEAFYIVTAQGEPLPARFAERLNLAIPYPVRDAWAEYLLEQGFQENLVRKLSLAGDDFQDALWVSKAGDWRTIIENGLKDGEIRL
ncbi:MAG: hypothetical protein RBS68_15335 [Anaerolineales bacterium]|jgi:hypothetical protein|nr:hypothetical protein [Anaerolineales bacterium]